MAINELTFEASLEDVRARFRDLRAEATRRRVEPAADSPLPGAVHDNVPRAPHLPSLTGAKTLAVQVEILGK